MAAKIAYYANHHGSGHIRHFQDIADTTNHELLLLSSRRPAIRTSFCALPDDRIEGYQEENTNFMYAPVAQTLIKRRFEKIHRALVAFDPDVVMVDVSYEVALFSRLAGYRTVVRRMHGDRTDALHQHLYAMSDGIFAFYEADLETPEYQFKYKTHYLGMVEIPLSNSTKIDNQVAVVTSLGGDGLSARELDMFAHAHPELRFVVAGKLREKHSAENIQPLGIINNTERLVAESSYVIVSGGHNAVTLGLSSGLPMIIVPEPRPFNEQHWFAAMVAKKYDQVLAVDTLEQASGFLTNERKALRLTAPAIFKRSFDHFIAEIMA